jgi:uncharacterized damage-inducible protein DinB
MASRIAEAIIGKGAHVPPDAALEDLTPTLARRRPDAALATVWEQLAHIVYWQDFTLAILEGKEPKVPLRAADGWPAMPPAESAAAEWKKLLSRFRRGASRLDSIARTKSLTARVRRGSRSTFGSMILVIGNHNSYHFGQIVSLRKMMGKWPPASGGDTW